MDVDSHSPGSEVFPASFETFMSVPHANKLDGNRSAIVGVPFDCGIHPVRIGSRYGPNAIRRQSALLKRFHPDFPSVDLTRELNLVDCGNIQLTPSRIESSYAAIESAMDNVLGSGARPVSFGGDGAVTLPQMRAAARQYNDLSVVHIDAHTDTFPGDDTQEGRHTTATTFYRAAEESLVEPQSSVHAGIRGPTTVPDGLSHSKFLGYHLIGMDELKSDGTEAVQKKIRSIVKDRPVYLCVDMDFFDPSCAPGVCAPTWGGPDAYSGLKLISGLRGIDIVAADINTVSPPHDVGGMTALLAATVAFEILALVYKLTGQA
jgi:agmatinase